MRKLTRAYLKSVLNYNADTGVFIRAVASKGLNNKVGDRAGWTKANGYTEIMVGGKTYKAHRLAWLYVYGSFPDGLIDHINGVRDDNRIANLRVATVADNQKNRKKNENNTSGLKGVHFRPDRNTYIARAMLNGKSHYIKSCKTAEEAGEAYANFAKSNHGEFFKDITK